MIFNLVSSTIITDKCSALELRFGPEIGQYD